MKLKSGDTLIEVTLAVGIFSMIAIAVVAVMSGGTSGAQSSLETTIAREEIDSQAEALRFIQASYIADKDNAADPTGKNRRFVELWKAITNNALTLSGTAEANNAILRFSPSTCKELYENSSSNNIFNQKAFIINTKSLGDFTTSTVNKVFISATTVTDDNKFTQATTFPRLVYSLDESAIAEDTTGSETLYRAEGIYIIAVKDFNTTRLVDEHGVSRTAAFYDFYIRSCWYGTDAKRPSTISTVIRLFDPDTI